MKLKSICITVIQHYIQVKRGKNLDSLDTNYYKLRFTKKMVLSFIISACKLNFSMVIINVKQKQTKKPT